MRIEEFAKANSLEMRIGERDDGRLPRFYASFRHAEVKKGSFLVGEYGDGDTKKEAIRNYATTISGKLLVINAYGKDRREIKVPRLN